MGMDRVIQKKKLPLGWILGIGAIAALIVVFVYQIRVIDKKPAQSVKKTDIEISTVIKGEFQEFFVANGYVAPARSLYIDSQEYGKVQHLYVEQGDIVNKGQVLLTLANDELESERLLKEAELANALKDMGNNGLRLTQMETGNRELLLELDHQVDVLQTDVDNKTTQFQAGGLSEKELEKARKELEFWAAKREIAVKSQELAVALLAQEGEKIGNSVEMFKIELRRNANRIKTLTVASPAYGQITELNASLGEIKNIGSHIAQLNIMDTLKLKATLDEYYLTKTRVGNKGEFTYQDGQGNSKKGSVTISWISPDVKGNTFDVDFKFDAIPSNIRIGQRFVVRVELGEKRPAVLLSQGSFFQTSGASWVFVVDPSGNTALRRSITAGRNNPEWIEVIKGLAAGERVIVSDYSRFTNLDKIELK